MTEKNIVISFLLLLTLLIGGCSNEQTYSDLDYLKFESEVNTLVLPAGFSPLIGVEENKLQEIVTNVQENFPNYNINYANIWNSKMNIPKDWKTNNQSNQIVKEVTEVLANNLKEFIENKEGSFEVGETTYEDWPEKTGVQVVGTWQSKSSNEDLILWEAKMTVSDNIYVTIIQVELP